MKSYVAKIPVLICALGLVFAAPTQAQVAGATLTGTITDAQGGAVVNAKVSVRDAATGITSETSTNSAGVYNLVNLKPADYDVTVTATGFTTSKTKVTLAVGAVQELSLSLKVGEMSQIVEVTGAAPVIETENATISGEVVGAQIQELPLNGRDWAQLATLEPGVAQVRPHEAVDAPGGSTRGLGMQMTIDGNRPQQNAYRLNGVIVNDYSNAGPGNVLGANMGVDAVQEFSVLTSNYSAEYGFTSGGVINAITKSGTNSFHGSGYEFIRNSKLDAADFFENANNEKKGEFIRNQFGASGGWKVLKDRAFLFGDYEGLRQVKAVPQKAQVLAPNTRLGIINDSNGNPLPAQSGTSCVYAGTGTPLDGTAMPNATNLSPGKAAVCVDNTIAKLISGSNGGLDPLPNGPLLGPDFNVGRYSTDGKQRVRDDYGIARGDLKVTEKDSLVGSWYRDHSTWDRPNRLNQDFSGFQVPHAAYTAEETHIFSPALVNTLRAGLDQSNLLSPAISTSNPLELDQSLGMLSSGCTAPGVSVGSSGLSANSATVTGFGGFTGAQGFYSRTAIIQVYDDVARTAGKHTMKFGFMYLGHHDDWGQGSGCGGSAAFPGYADFLQNLAKSVRMPALPPFTSGPTTHHYRNRIFGGYVQDDWKFRPNLTMNIGLRYEMATIPYETQDKINQFETLYQNPAPTGTPCTADLNGLAVCPGFYHQTFQRNPTLRNFEPRVGFAWDPFKTGKTSVRGGFGFFDVLPLPYLFALNSLQTAPNGAEVDLKSLSSNNFLAGDYPKGYPGIAMGVAAGASSRYGYNEQFPKRNYVMQWNFNIQRQLTTDTSVTLAYTGSRGIHNPFQTDELNTVFPYKSSAGWLFPLTPSNVTDSSGVVPLGTPVVCSSPLLSGAPCGSGIQNPTAIVPGLLINSHTADIQSTIFQAQSWYEALQVKMDKRLSHGFQVGGSFTWGKSFDTSSSSFAGDNYSNNISPTIPWWDLSITKGLSDFNVTRNLVINALWNIPTPALFNGPAGWIARGWGVQTIFEISDGTPLWLLDGVEGDPMGQLNGEPIAIPDRVPGCQLTFPSSGRTGSLQYINPACFINAVAPNSSFASAAPPFGCDQSFILNYAHNNPSLPALNPLTCINLLGNLGRNTVIGPGLFNIDFSAVKDTHIKKFSENFDVQFRAEFFNVLNHTNFAPPDASNLEALDATGVTPAGFGTLSTTQVPNREIQFALKLIW